VQIRFFNAYIDDPAFVAAEYGGQFRDDIAAFVSREVHDACVDVGVYERQPNAKLGYRAFVDPSGGSSESMALAIGHRENDAVMLDLLREIRAPFSPEAAVEELCGELARYRVQTVSGDKYAGEWPAEQFAKRDVSYEPSAMDASKLYRKLCRDRTDYAYRTVYQRSNPPTQIKAQHSSSAFLDLC
jgi:hypothetical protein